MVKFYKVIRIRFPFRKYQGEKQHDNRGSVAKTEINIKSISVDTINSSYQLTYCGQKK